jgi:hypothetical protein
MRWAELRMCRFWAGGISSFPFSRAREYRLLRRLCRGGNNFARERHWLSYVIGGRIPVMLSTVHPCSSKQMCLLKNAQSCKLVDTILKWRTSVDLHVGIFFWALSFAWYFFLDCMLHYFIFFLLCWYSIMLKLLIFWVDILMTRGEECWVLYVPLLT